MAQYRSGRLAILITTIFLLLPAHAQQSSSPALQNAPVILGVMDTCQNNSPDNPCGNIIPEFTQRTLTFQIPEFQPGDHETHVYVVARISNNGTGAGTAKADEDGLLREQVAVSADSRDETQYYFIAFDKNTLEPRITLDLYEVRLRPFLNSLQGALRMGIGVAAGIRLDHAGARSLMIELQQYQNQQLSIHGENLTVDELLDKFYQETRCIVDQKAQGLVIASCP